MKYFICLLALVAIYGNQVDSSSATWRIDSEAKADQNRMKVQILTEGAKVKNRIKLRTEGYIEDFLSLTSEMDDRLARRSSAGEVISTKLKVRFMQAINDLKATFSEQMTKPEIKNIVESLKRECIDAFKQDIDTIKVAVEDKRRVIKCWDSYRKDSRANYDATIQTIVDTVDSKTDEIDDKATALKKQFKDALEKIEADNTCGSDDECTEKYFLDNSDKIFNQLSSFAEKAENEAKDTMGEVVNLFGSTLDGYRAKYAEVREKIQPCIDSV